MMVWLALNLKFGNQHLIISDVVFLDKGWDCHGHMVVGYTTTCAISAYITIECCEFESHSGEVHPFTTLQQVCVF